MAYWTYRIILWLLALVYAYFAFFRMLNITGMNGFDWATAPVSSQILDVFYLAINLVVIYGFVLARPLGFVAFFVAAFSQLVLFILTRPDFEPAGAGGPDFIAIIFDFRVAFQLFTIALVLIALWLKGVSARRS